MTGEKLPLQEIVTRFETNQAAYVDAERRLIGWFKDHSAVAQVAGHALRELSREAAAKRGSK